MNLTLSPTTSEISTDPDLESLRFTAAVYLVLANALDLYTTRYQLAAGHHEGNALMASVIQSNWAYVIKLGLPAVLGWRWLAAPLLPRVVKGMVCICWIYTAVLVWNAHWSWMR